MREPARPPRLVVDTNVMISGLIRGDGPPGIILQAVRSRKVILLASAVTAQELLRVLEYPRIRKYFANFDAMLEAVAALLLTGVERLDPETRLSISSDRDDNAFLELAVDGRATAVVTGDKSHLLSLSNVAGIPIITARVCVDRFGLQHDQRRPK